MTPYIILLLTFASYLLNRLALSHFYKAMKNTEPSSLSGDEIAQRILGLNSISTVKIKKMEVHGQDLYDPLLKVIQLGPRVYGNKTIYSLAVGSHEACHVLDFQYFRFLYIPSFLLTKFIFIPLFIVSFFNQSPIIHGTVILLYLSVFLFKFFVEVLDEVHINKMALRTLIQHEIVPEAEIIATRKMYWAFNLTYLTSLPMKIFFYN